MVSIQYRLQTGRKLDLKNPKRFTEKLQVYKIKYRNPLMHQCSDKAEVRNYVKNLGLEEILIPIHGIYNDPYSIDFERLPNQFVAKTSDGGGGNQIFLCIDKSEVNKEEFIKTLLEWQKAPKPRKNIAREWAYENKYPRRFIIEELISPDKPLYDYKFFCFKGKVKFIYGISDRRHGDSAELGIYDTDFNKLEAYRLDERFQTVPLPKPENFHEMIKIAETLAGDFPEVRVDLYNVDGKIYFGELTFYDGSGYMKYGPDEFDFQAGEFFDISEFQ